MKRSLTSPSNFHRRYLCPGSARMESQVPEESGAEASEWSAEGTRLHKLFAEAIATPEDRQRVTPTAVEKETILDAVFAPLPEDDKAFQIVHRAKELQAKAIADVQRNCGIAETEPFTEGYELPLPFIFDGQTYFEGTCDYWRFWQARGVLLILDFKAGFIEVEGAESNWQLACYGVMAREKFDALNVVVGIIQPRVFSAPGLVMASYERGQLRSASKLIYEGLANAMKPDAPVVPGDDQCRYCRAKFICEPYKAKYLQLVVPEGKEVLSTVDSETLGRWGDVVKAARSKVVGDAINAEINRRIEAGEMPGWELKPTGSMTEIGDALAAYHSLKEAFPEMTADDFLACVDVPITPLTKWIQGAEKISEAKAKAKLKAVLADNITTKEKSASIQRVK